MSSQQYDVSEKEKELIRKRAQMRDALKKEYIKQITNPHRHAKGEGGMVFDQGIQRFMAMRATRHEFFKPSYNNFFKMVFLLVVPVGLYGYLLKTDRENYERRCRSGEIPYKDRVFKFNS